MKKKFWIISLLSGALAFVFNPIFSKHVSISPPIISKTDEPSFTNFSISSAIPSMKIQQLLDSIQQLKGTVVVNFWATFCKPCVEEMPVFLSVQDSMRRDSVHFIFVSLDLPSFYPNRIQQFIQQKNWKLSTLWLNETNADRFCPIIDPGWSGAIPATLILHPEKGYRRFYEQSLKKEFLQARILDARAGIK